MLLDRRGFFLSGSAALLSACATVPRREACTPLAPVNVDPARVTAMGKVGGVMTGVVLAAHDHVLIADEDVVYTEAELERVDRWLDEVDMVRPQNWFDALPWHDWAAAAAADPSWWGCQTVTRGRSSDVQPGGAAPLRLRRRHRTTRPTELPLQGQHPPLLDQTSLDRHH